MKLGKDLQRRIAKLREENKDPALPQKPTRTSSAASASTSAAASPPQPIPSPTPQPTNNVNTMSDSQQTVDESFMLLGQRVSNYSFVHAFCSDSGVNHLTTSKSPVLSRVDLVRSIARFCGTENFRNIILNTDLGPLYRAIPETLSTSSGRQLRACSSTYRVLSHLPLRLSHPKNHHNPPPRQAVVVEQRFATAAQVATRTSRTQYPAKSREASAW